MFEGRHPDSGEFLGRSHGRNAVPAFDVALRPTKSVSVLYGLGDPADRHGNREPQGVPEDLVRSFSKRAGQIDAMELMEMVDTPGLRPGRRPRDRAAAGQDGQAAPGDPAPR
jgi:TrwC relaxase